ncbi:Mini-ribonuclease 3 [Clostridium sediminicola]|uniref:Mini-ribonuclease 3 n=1 Tax=Clostridium sediminicola TaxID=3114879 RepID=UPI0031F23F90
MEYIKFKGKFTSANVREMNPLVLAYMGDCIYESYIRTYLIDENRSMLPHKLHKLAINYVSAHGQFIAMAKIQSELTEEEYYFFKRGRNCKSATVPKNAKVNEYRIATGFETLIGYLYLTEQVERIDELLGKVVK